MTPPRAPRAPLRPYRSRLALPGVLALAFAALAWVVLARHGTPYPLDTGPHRWSVRHRPHAAAVAARDVTAAGTGPYPYVAAAVGGWLAGGRTRRNGTGTALLAVAVLLAGQSLRTLLMALAHRPRPPVADWAARASGHSFPSGHTTSSAIAAGLLAWGLTRALPGRGGRIAAGACAAAAAAVGCTRVYLGVHWPTDVLGGWLLAGCWLAAALPPLARYADSGPGDPRPLGPVDPRPVDPGPAGGAAPDADPGPDDGGRPAGDPDEGGSGGSEPPGGPSTGRTGGQTETP